MLDFKAFTVKSNGLLDRVASDVLILPALQNTSSPMIFSATWDTGATRSCISRRVAEQLGLLATGALKVGTANGLIEADTFLVDIMLSNGVLFPKLLVVGGNLSKGVDALIGMDVISKGDFAITNFNGRTTFSFRIPSTETVDFLKRQI